MPHELMDEIAQLRNGLRSDIGSNPIDIMPVRDFFVDLKSRVNVDFEPYLPLHEREENLSRALAMVLDLEDLGRDYAAVYTGYIFGIYVCRKFGVRNV